MASRFGESLSLKTNEEEMQKVKESQSFSSDRPGLHKGLLSPGASKSGRRPLELGAREVVLSPTELRVLFTEIATYGTRIEASQKSHPESKPEVVTSLARLFVELSGRTVFGAQIWYEYEGILTTDTLISHADGVTCVRNESFH